MKDYNLRSRDIYGDPQQGGTRRWATLGVVLAIAAAAITFFLSREQATSPEVIPAGTADPNIIPLTLPPRRPMPGPAESR
jgi:hypothetical protein